MTKRKQVISLDEIGLIIIGAGASGLYLYFEKMMMASQNLTIFITVAIILLISLFTQILINAVIHLNQVRSIRR